MNYNKLECETVKNYIRRMCADRIKNGLTWFEVRDLINEELGTNFSESYYRKNYALGNFDEVDTELSNTYCSEKIDNAMSDRDNPEDILKRIEAEKIKMSDERNERNALLRRLVREDTCKEIGIKAANIVASQKFLSEPHVVSRNNEERVAIAVISDWHLGIEVDSYWNKYNPDICAERVSSLLLKTKDICEKENISDIYVVNLSDLIAGRIHAQIRIQSRYDVISQTITVSEILSEYIDSLASTMRVHYYDCLDNHSRVEPNKKESLDLESLARIIPWYLKERFKNNENVFIYDNPYSEDIISFNVLGHKVAGVHGDRDTPNHIVENINMLTEEHFDLILTAHLHHFSADEKCRTVVVSNGSLMGQDSFAERLRLNCDPSQNVIIVTKSNVTEVIYRVVV